MRVLVSSTPGYGHVLPMVPLARALLAAGHEVLWATAADACSRVAAAGIEAVPAGRTEAQLVGVRRTIAAAVAGLRPEQVPLFVFPRLFGEARTPQMVHDLVPVAAAVAARPRRARERRARRAAGGQARRRTAPSRTRSAAPCRRASSPTPLSGSAPLWAEQDLPLPPYAGCYEDLYLDICPPALQTVSLDHIARSSRCDRCPTPASRPRCPPG